MFFFSSVFETNQQSSPSHSFTESTNQYIILAKPGSSVYSTQTTAAASLNYSSKVSLVSKHGFDGL